MITFICGDRACWKHFQLDVQPATRFPLTCPRCGVSLFPADMRAMAIGTPGVELLWALPPERRVEPVPSASRARAHGLAAVCVAPDPARWTDRDLHPCAFGDLVGRAAAKEGGRAQVRRPRTWWITLPLDRAPGTVELTQGLNLLEDGRVELTCDADLGDVGVAAAVARLHERLGDALATLHGRAITSFDEAERCLRERFEVVRHGAHPALEVKLGREEVVVTAVEEGGEHWLLLRAAPIADADPSWCLEANTDLVELKLEAGVDGAACLSGTFPLVDLTAHRLVARIEALAELAGRLAAEHAGRAPGVD